MPLATSSVSSFKVSPSSNFAHLALTDSPLTSSHEQHPLLKTPHITSHSIIALYSFSWLTRQPTLVPTYTALKTAMNKPNNATMLFANAIVNGTTVILAAFMRTGVLPSQASAVNCKLHQSSSLRSCLANHVNSDRGRSGNHFESYHRCPKHTTSSRTQRPRSAASD
jgi:hypothetical protein